MWVSGGVCTWGARPQMKKKEIIKENQKSKKKIKKMWVCVTVWVSGGVCTWGATSKVKKMK